jgi:hypothetical protein
VHRHDPQLPQQVLSGDDAVNPGEERVQVGCTGGVTSREGMPGGWHRRGQPLRVPLRLQDQYDNMRPALALVPSPLPFPAAAPLTSSTCLSTSATSATWDTALSTSWTRQTRRASTASSTTSAGRSTTAARCGGWALRWALNFASLCLHSAFIDPLQLPDCARGGIPQPPNPFEPSPLCLTALPPTPATCRCAR